MGLNLGNKISSSDLNNMDTARQPRDFEPGFEDSSGGNGMSDNIDFDSIFDGDDGTNSSADDPFGAFSTGGSGGSSNNDPFGAGGSSGGGLDSLFGTGGNSGGNSGTDIFGQSNGGAFGNTFGQTQNGFGSIYGQNLGQAQTQNQPGKLDDIVNGGIELAKDTGSILEDLVKSFKTRNIDDFGYLGRNFIIVGGIMTPIGLIAGIVGSIAKLKILSFSGLGFTATMSGGLLIGIGAVTMGVAAFILDKFAVDGGNIDQLNDVSMEIPDDSTNDYEQSNDAVNDDLFGSELDAILNNTFDDMDNEDEDLDDEEDEDTVDIDINNEPEVDVDDMQSGGSGGFDFSDGLDTIQENQVLSRETLFNTFKLLLPTVTPNFRDKQELDSSSDEFKQLEVLCLKAMAYVVNVDDFTTINSSLEIAYKTLYVYELRMKRIPKIKTNNLDQLAKEIENYVRDNANDISKQVTISIEGDFYVILITTGDSAVVSLGDVLRVKDYSDYFLSTKHRLPIISGITELGDAICDDAKLFDSMMIAGKPRSGKSWYVLSILACLMLFNTPEDVLFMIIDPKASNLFKTIGLMPHVFGVHTDDKILQRLDEIINIEAPRRKRLLEDNRKDDIWALREEAGIKLPILYIVIDEYITVRNNLGDASGDLDTKVQTIISQFPSLGIRLLFVPHRATGVVNKTNRTMLQFTAAVRANIDDVNDTLDIKSWKRPLVKPGDTAIKTSSNPLPQFVRGAALTNSDTTNTEFIKMAAKAFYKMGVDIPPMNHLPLCYSRNEDDIKEQLGGEERRVQYDAQHVFDNEDTNDDIDF